MADDHDTEPCLVLVAVCELCLSGTGGECHVPGCLFWMHDAPTEPLRTTDG